MMRPLALHRPTSRSPIQELSSPFDMFFHLDRHHLVPEGAHLPSLPAPTRLDAAAPELKADAGLLIPPPPRQPLYLAPARALPRLKEALRMSNGMVLVCGSHGGLGRESSRAEGAWAPGPRLARVPGGSRRLRCAADELSSRTPSIRAPRPRSAGWTAYSPPGPRDPAAALPGRPQLLPRSTSPPTGT